MQSLGALPILMYHHVSPTPGLVTVSPQAFRAQMQALKFAGWRSAGLDELEGFFAGQPLREKTCVISFDDGYFDNYVHAHPFLAELGMKAVLFLVTGWLGDGPVRTNAEAICSHSECKRRIAADDTDSVMLRWSEVDLMAKAGTFEFHSHTHRHTRFDRQIADPLVRGEALAADLQASRETLRARFGTVSRHLCWPQGYYDEQYVAVARAAGFDHLYTTETRINRPGSDVARIGRFVTKEKSGDWLLARTKLYARPWLGSLYGWLKG